MVRHALPLSFYLDLRIMVLVDRLDFGGFLRAVREHTGWSPLLLSTITGISHAQGGVVAGVAFVDGAGFLTAHPTRCADLRAIPPTLQPNPAVITRPDTTIEETGLGKRPYWRWFGS